MTEQDSPISESKTKAIATTIQTKIAEGLMDTFSLVVADRSAFFATHPDEIPHKSAARAIIDAYAAKNFAVSGGANLIPGPWGMLAVVPEITIVIRNQLAMIYDVGMAYGQGKVLTKELLAGVLMTALGASAGSLIVMHGAKVFVRRVALRSFQRIISILAGKVTQQVLKSMIGRWLPIVGAAALAVWSNFLTRRIGKAAIEIFEKEIVLSDGVIEELPLELLDSAPDVAVIGPFVFSSGSPDLLRAQTLINLMKVDGSVKSEEREYVETIIGNANLTEGERAGLAQAIDSGEKFAVDYGTFSSSPDDAAGLLVDLIALAKRDGVEHIAEKLFIKQVGRLLGFSEGDIEETMASIALPQQISQ